MKTEKITVSTDHKTDYGVPNQKIHVVLRLNLPETLAEVVEKVGEDGKGSAGELAISMWKTRALNKARQILKEIVKEVDPNGDGIEDVDAFEQAATNNLAESMPADWNPQMRRGSSVNPKEEFVNKIKNMSREEQMAALADLMKRLGLQP